MHSDWGLNDDEIRSLQLERQIGEGSYGKVYRARLSSTSTIYAVKVVEIDLDQDDAQKFKDTSAYKTMEQEISILKTCVSCPQIVRVFGIGVRFGEDQKARVMVVMELCDHGSVSDLMRRLGKALVEAEIRVIVREVLLGLKYLHDDKKIHRDIKAGNILLTKTFCPKLADFGISCELQNTCAKRETQIGSPYWMAPEVIKAGFGYNSRADIWSLGITCVEMAEMQPPYYHIPAPRAMFVITTKPPTGLTDPGLTKQVSKDFVGFISACLTVDPAARPPAQALLALPFAQRQEGEASPADLLEASLGPKIAEAQLRDQGDAFQRRNWQRRSPNGSMSLLPRSGSGNMLSGVLPLEAATPSVDAYAGATMSFASAGRRQAGGRWHAEGSPVGSTAGGRPTAGGREEGDEEDVDAEEIRRRAREWVNRTVPMQTVEDEVDTPQSGKADFRVWDSEDEGVATRTRMEAQPEAGAGGPSGSTPFFMQVLGKQWGN